MNLIDIHAHLDYKPLADDSAGVVQRAKEAGVTVIIANGTSPESNRQVIALSKQFDIVKPALGFYPTHVHATSEEELDKELAFIKEQQPIALGEVGLDYKFAPEDPNTEKIDEETKQSLIEKQKKGFQKIIHLAKELDIPLIVHSRKAELDVIELLEQSGHKKIIMHCFCGKKKLVERIRDNGWTFSIPVTVIKLFQFQEVVEKTNISQLLTETDSPWLGPEPGLTNEPKNIPLIVQKIAEIKKMDVEEVANNIFMNYQRLFL